MKLDFFKNENEKLRKQIFGGTEKINFLENESENIRNQIKTGNVISSLIILERNFTNEVVYSVLQKSKRKHKFSVGK